MYDHAGFMVLCLMASMLTQTQDAQHVKVQYCAGNCTHFV